MISLYIKLVKEKSNFIVRVQYFGKHPAMNPIVFGINGRNSKLAENRNDNWIIYGKESINTGEIHKGSNMEF